MMCSHRIAARLSWLVLLPTTLPQGSRAQTQRWLCGPAFGLVAEEDALDDGLDDVFLVV
jgi:hypothetical protein